MPEEIRIACEGAAEIALSEFVELQGPLKSLSVDNYTKLKNVIIEHGFSAPVSVWRHKDKFKIIDGHQRVRVLRGMLDEGYKIPKKIPVVWIEAKSEKEAVLKCLSAASAYGHVEDEGLYELMVKHKLTMGDVKNIELPKIELPKFAQNYFEEPTEGNIPDDEIPETRETSVKLGDLYQLGDHRLLCADCTVKENVERLMAGEKAVLMVTDPPYGVNYDPEWRNKALGEANSSIGLVKNDSIVDWTHAYNLFSGGVAYIWHGHNHGGEVQRNIESCGYKIINFIVWVKQHFALSRGDYHWQHEALLYAAKEKHNWQGARDQSTVWQINNGLSQLGGKKDPHDEQTGHGTQKPVECMERPIRNNSTKGEGVYDPFLGSGSTLIACEKTKRKCYGMEIDPHYCQVIIDRWEKFTGKKAVKLEDAKPKVIVRKKDNQNAVSR